MSRKTLCLLALLAMAPAAMAVEMGIYGQALLGLDYLDSSDYPGPDSDKPLAVNGNRSWLGFRGEEGLRQDLSLIWRGEVYMDLDQGGWGDGREAYVGLRHRFGTLTGGKQSTPYRLAGERLDVFADTRADYHGVLGNVDGDPIFGDRMQRLVSYRTPRIRDFQFALAVSPAYERGGDKDHYAYSAALDFASGPLYAALAYEQLKDYVSVIPRHAASASGNARAYKLALGWDFGQGTRLGLVAEKAKSGVRVGGDDLERPVYYMSLSQVLGNATLRAAGAWVGRMDGVSNSSAIHLALGLGYALSPRAEIFAQAAWTGNDDGAAYGMVADDDDPDPLLPALGKDIIVATLGLRYRFDHAF